ncbi:MAG: response regulator transcription factor [Saprospiraceae bacterium]|nr:response regulator transcription factor [Saprospiraceae bacterium]
MQMIINGEADLTVTYQAENGSRFLDDVAAGKADVDIVLLDLSMPIMDGVDVLLKTASMTLPFKIIVLTSHYNDSIILKLLDEGAAGFLAKTRSAHRPDYYPKRSTARILHQRLHSQPHPKSPTAKPEKAHPVGTYCQRN